MKTLIRHRTVAIMLLAAVPFAAAHEFWIQPSAFHAAADSLIKVHLMVGSQFPGDPVARDPERIVKFSSFGPSGEQPIVGRDGMDPAGLCRFKQPGIYTLAYTSNPAPLTMEAAKFEEYLRDKGLEKIIDARATAGQSQAESHELFSRCCKSLIQVGGAGSDGQSKDFDRVVGLPLELTALDNPCIAKPGDALHFRVDDDGTPCGGLLVTARNPAHTSEIISARSGPDGAVTLSLPYDGMWVVGAVQMADAPKDSGAQWESLWASLSFQIGDPGAEAPAGRQP